MWERSTLSFCRFSESAHLRETRSRMFLSRESFVQYPLALVWSEHRVRAWLSSW
jgi:hypothetical protein